MQHVERRVARFYPSVGSHNSNKYQLPKITGTHHKTIRAINFLKKHKIKDTQSLITHLQKINNSNTQNWMDVANEYRHSEEKIKLNLAATIYKVILNERYIARRARSFAAIGISKIHGRNNNKYKSINFALASTQMDNTNGYAWHRYGDVLKDLEERKACYLKALEIAQQTNDTQLQAQAYFGLGDIRKNEGDMFGAATYFNLSLLAQPEYEPAKRALNH